MIPDIYGLQLFESPHITKEQEQEILIRFKGRGIAIHRKTIVRVPAAYRIGNAVMMHPKIAQELRDQIGKSTSEMLDRLYIQGNRPLK